MQLHIVGTHNSLENRQAKEELAAVLRFWGLTVVIEEQFSGDAGVGVVLTPPFDCTRLNSNFPVLLLDVEGNLENAVGSGFADLTGDNPIDPVGVINLPLSPSQLGAALRSLRASHCLALSPQTRELPTKNAATVARIPGEHSVLDSLRLRIATVAQQAGPVLVCGETGSGKRRVAEAIYQCSRGSDGPFVPVSCATFPEMLLAIELFGCESGALPGASHRRIGRIEMAEGGVLLLEDIEALSIQSQASLLAFLRSKRLERVGSTKGTPSDVRLIVSTSVNLEVLVERGEFREDLFYALQEFVVDVPSLRDYIAALPDMLGEINSVFQAGALTAEAWDALRCYDWPGNVKELTNFASQVGPAAQTGVLDTTDLPGRILGGVQTPAPGVLEPDALQPGVLHPEAMQPGVMLPVNGLDLKPYLAALEKTLISQALEDTGFVVARAADRLHIRRTTLVEKMRKYGLQRG